jgi:hypothetical protein
VTTTTITPAVALALHYRQAGGFRPMLLALLGLAYGVGDSWEPPSMAALKRALTRPGDETACSTDDAEAAIAHAVAMGLLAEESTISRLVLAGGEAE